MPSLRSGLVGVDGANQLKIKGWMIGWVLKAKSVFGGAEIENRLDPRF